MKAYITPETYVLDFASDKALMALSTSETNYNTQYEQESREEDGDALDFAW